MRTKSLILFMLVSIALFSCRKDDPKPTNIDDIETIEDLQVPDNFTWETTHSYLFNINTQANGIVEIRSTDGKVYHKAFVINSNSYSVNLTLPVYLEKIQVVQYGTIAEIDLTGDVINCQVD